MSDDPTPPNDSTPDPPAPRTFTQEQLDRVVQERLARQKAQFSDYDDLKTAKTELDQLKAASQSETEKAQTRAAELEKQLADTTSRAKENALRAAVIAEAARKNVVDPDAAVALINRSALEFADDGTPTNVADAMDSLLQDKPYLLAGQTTRPGSADQGARSGGGAKQITREQLSTMTDAQYEAARAAGELKPFGVG